MPIKKIVEYLEEDGTSSFAKWFSDLNAEAAAKINTAIIRMENGNLSDVASVGSGVFKRKIHFGPGYRIYFAQEGAGQRY